MTFPMLCTAAAISRQARIRTLRKASTGGPVHPLNTES